MRKKLALGAVAAASAMVVTGVLSGSATATPNNQSPIGRSQADALSLARSESAGVAKSLGLGAKEQLKVKDAIVDADGSRHLRYERTYAGLPVLGGDLVVHQDKHGATTSVTKATGAKIAVAGTTPAVAASAAKAKASATAKALLKTHKKGDEALKSVGAAAAPRKVVWAASGKPALAWETVVDGVQHDGAPSELHVVTDARTGAVIASFEGIKTGSGNGVRVGKVTITTHKSGTRYQLKDNTRGGLYTTDLGNKESDGKGTLFTDANNIWGNGKTTSRQSAGVDAHFGAEATWDYYKSAFGRKGIKNDNKGSLSRTHYGKGFVNAFWSDACFCMTYGDGEGDKRPLTSLDVAGHEISHGVTSATADLNYFGESGGLNEGTSDIYGTMVEFKKNLTVDKPDYYIGEKINIFGNGKPLRYMDKPSKDGISYDYWFDGVGNDDPHFTSGIANHFFYLLAEGSGKKIINGNTYNSPTYDGSKVTGIGRTKAALIWYKSLTTQFTSTTDYHGARTGTLAVAKKLYGSTSAEYKAVNKAWAGVNVK
ncbi:peptidase [Wenjunlia tyrosinilytica]|uniref:Neutral metalloproteinase n=1 Tax=Wenjunlia tyrosinilytica TaxID=1544741 RepID=A0A917ZTK4_9ACTN|nr:peptidase [Wenjunlia tyrosinilytica]